MTAFDTKNGPSATLLTFQRDDSIFTAVKHASGQHSRDSAAHCDLLTLLFITEALDVDLLPITWNAALGSLGQGATGNVQQSIVDARTNFAFKRSLPSRHYSDEYRYEATISEVMVLRARRRRSHPNIVELVGIGWDVNPHEKSVWPVLVFRKAEFGSLKRYLSSPIGSDLSWEIRVSLCRDTVSGLAWMHPDGVLHGDLKPDNLIVGTNEEGKPQAKLIDFAFPCWGATDDDLVWMPWSPPWTAPEHEWKEFSLREGKKHGRIFIGHVEAKLKMHWSNDGIALTACTDTGPLETLEMIEILKNALNGISQDFGRMSGEIWSFLTSTLSTRSVDRELDLSLLSKLLADSVHDELRPLEIFDPAADMSISMVAHGVPVLHKRLALFEYASFLVRDAIFASLSARAGNVSECPECSFLAAAQVSYCYQVGFGTPRDVAAAENWRQELRRRVSLSEDLNHAVAVFGEQLQYVWEHPFDPVNSFRGLFDAGLLDFCAASQLLSSLPIKEVIARIEVERASREAQFGEEHDSALYYKLLLSTLYARSGQSERAKSIVKQVYAILESSEPEFRRDRIGIVARLLVDSLRQCGDLRSARFEAEKLLQKMQDACGSDHPNTYDVMTDVAQLMADMGDFGLATTHQEAVLVGLENRFGKYHLETIRSMQVLTSIYIDKGSLDQAEFLARAVIERCKEVVGHQDECSLAARKTLAAILYYREQNVEAEKECQGVFHAFEQQLGLMDERTLSTGCALSSVLIRLDRYREAEILTERLLSTSSIGLGKLSRITLALTNNLAVVKAQKEDFDAARSLYQNSIHMIQDSQGHSSPDLITPLSNMANLYYSEGNYGSAWAWSSKALELAKQYYDPPHVGLATIQANSDLYARKLGSIRVD